MGTSSSFGGPGGGTPLVPSWLGDESASPRVPDGSTPEGQSPDGASPVDGLPVPPPRGPIPPIADSGRFSAPRNNFSRFARSGGTDNRNLGRAVSRYVRSSVQGARTAAVRMGSSPEAGSRLLGFLSDAAARGGAEALRAINFGQLAGRPIDEIFLGLVDYVCPDGGSIDEGIARASFIETIADIAETGLKDLDSLTVEQVQKVFELYATNTIEARLCNDIGNKVITLPSNVLDVARVQAQLHDFIKRSVADALAAAQFAAATLTPKRVLRFVQGIYEQAFTILRAMGEREAG